MPQAGTAWVPVYPDTRRVTPETRKAFSSLGPYPVEVEARLRNLDGVRRALQSLPHIVLPVTADDHEIVELRRKLQELSDRTVGVNISAAQARGELDDIARRLDALGLRSADIGVRVDAGAASAALQATQGEVSRLDGRTIQVKAIADTARAVAALGALFVAYQAMQGETVSIQVVADTARAVASLALVAAKASALSGAVASVTALGGAALALGPAAAIGAGGLSTLLLASSGVGDAMSAMQGVQDAAGKSAAEQATANEKLALAMAGLSAPAQDFARYLFGLNAQLDRLKGVAAAGIFPPLTAGLQEAMTHMATFELITANFAGALGQTLNNLLFQLTSPYWLGFFTTLSAAATTVLPLTSFAFMEVAQAVAELLLALLPLAPTALQIVVAFGHLLQGFAPFVGVLVAALLPAADAFLAALVPLGPVLAALGPILAVLAQSFALVLAAVLQALAPVLVALTPLIAQMAMAWGVQLAGSIAAVTPFIVAVATWLSQHPGLVMGVVGALGALWSTWTLITGVVSSLLGPLLVLRLVTLALGISAAAVGGAFASVLATLASSFSVWSLFSTLLGFAGGAIGGLVGGLGGLLRTILMAIGPVGWIIIAFGLLWSSSEAFRIAVMGLLTTLGQIVGLFVAALMPVFQALIGLVNIIMGAFGALLAQLAAALVPVLNMLAGVLMQLAMALLPPLISVVNALLPVFGLLGQIVLLVFAAFQPVIGVLMQLISAILPVLAAIITSVVVPVVSFLARVFADEVGFVLRYVVVPALQFLVWILTNVTVPIMQWFASMVGPILTGIGVAAQWLGMVFGVVWNAISAAISFAWNSIIAPVLNALWILLRFVGAIIFTVLVAPFVIAWNIISAIISFAWNNVILPVFNALVTFINSVIVPAIVFLYNAVVRPIFDAIGTAISVVWNFVVLPVFNALVTFINSVIIPLLRFLLDNVVRPIFDGIGLAISVSYNRVILPIWTALVTFINTVIIPLLRFLLDNVVKPIWDGIGTAIRVVWETVIRPAWEAVATGLNFLRDRFRDGVNQIGQLWAGIKAMLARPINFMIDVVWNRGVVPVWNKVASLVGIGPIQPLGLIPEFATGGVYEPHRYTPGRDIGLAAVGGNEAIMRPEWTRVVGHDYVAAANAAARTGGTAGVTAFLNTASTSSTRAEGETKQALMRRYPLDDTRQRVRGPWAGGFAYGGVAPHVAFAGAEVERMFGRLPGGIGGVGSRANASDHTSGHALDFMTLSNMGLGDRIAGHMEQHAERLAVKYIIWKQAINQGKGWRGMENRGSPTANHFDHPHVSFEGGPLGGKWGDGPMGGGGIASFFNPLPGIIRGLMDAAKGVAMRAVGGLVGQPPPEYRRVPPGLTAKMFDTMRDWAAGKAEAIGGGSGAAMGPLGAGAPFYIAEIARAARDRGLGVDGATIGVATALVETGNIRMLANPRRPDSLRFPHDGLAQDHDSVGLFQQRANGAWGNTAQQMNAYASASMFFNKLASFNWRAMDPGAAAQKVQVSAFPGKYATRMAQARGLVAQHGGPFDDGGEAWGTGWMLKEVIAPERVLPPRETQAYPTLTRLSQQLAAGQVPVASAEVAAARAAAMSGPGPVQFPRSFRLTSDTALRLDGDGVLHIVDGRLEALADALDAGRPD